MPPNRTGRRANILGSCVSNLSWDEAVDAIVAGGETRSSRYVCVCNVHSVVSGARDARFKRILNEADMVTPDGAPIAWAMRQLGFPDQERINGPDLMWRYLARAEQQQQTVFFYGSSIKTLAHLRLALARVFPDLRIGGMHSPPYRSLTAAEDAAEVDFINRSGAQVVLVSLGCPKQEEWMASHRGRINAVMVGVGAAFDYHAGVLRRAPLWWQAHGLEWLYRLLAEPRRLFKRYATTNTLFVLGLMRQILQEWRYQRVS